MIVVVGARWYTATRFIKYFFYLCPDFSKGFIGKYERDEMTPSIDAAKKSAKILNTTVGYLLGEEQQADLKDIAMLKRFQDITTLPDKEEIVSS